jgi:hypothetical protein
VTLVIVGLWHGAAWTFILFGLIHGVVMAGARIFRALTPLRPWRRSRSWRLVGQVVTLGFVCLTVLLYRAPTVGEWTVVMRGLANWSVDGLQLPWQIWLALVVGTFSQLVPERLVSRVQAGWIRWPGLAQGAVITSMILLLYALSPPGVTPFIYFQF